MGSYSQTSREMGTELIDRIDPDPTRRPRYGFEETPQRPNIIEIPTVPLLAGKPKEGPRVKDWKFIPYLYFIPLTILLTIAQYHLIDADERHIVVIPLLAIMGVFFAVAFTLTGFAIHYAILRLYFDHSDPKPEDAVSYHSGHYDDWEEFLIYRVRRIYQFECEIVRFFRTRKEDKLRRRKRKKELKELFG